VAFNRVQNVQKENNTATYYKTTDISGTPHVRNQKTANPSREQIQHKMY